jgi:exonuclease SbcD
MRKSLSVLHFADAHVDIINHGRHDPDSGLPVRVVDFLNSLDQIIDRAIDDQVDLVLFAGDAYKDRNPQPTFQREWGQRIMRLSQAGIPTVLLVGNHDVSPASGRAHTLQEFQTLNVPHVHVADRITRLDPAQLGIPAQVITIPWVSRHALMTREEMAGRSQQEVFDAVEDRVANSIDQLIAMADPDLPLILTAHASVQGAVYGSERQVMLGQEMILGGSIVADKRLDYVALGHIHKHQDVSKGGQPPIVYPGSIERIDFGEVREKKGFVLAEIAKGNTQWRFEVLKTRRFVDLKIESDSAETFMADILAQLPDADRIQDAVCRLNLYYPRELEPQLDEVAIARHIRDALSFHIAKHRSSEQRSRLGDTLAIETLSAEELLSLYWDGRGMDPEEVAALKTLAREIIGEQLTH